MINNGIGDGDSFFFFFKKKRVNLDPSPSFSMRIKVRSEGLIMWSDNLIGSHTKTPTVLSLDLGLDPGTSQMRLCSGTFRVLFFCFFS